MAASKHESDEQTGGRAVEAVVGFYFVGVSAVLLIEWLEGEAVIPRLHRPAVLVGVDLGGVELFDREVMGPRGNYSEPPQSGRSVGADLDSLRNVEAVGPQNRTQEVFQHFRLAPQGSCHFGRDWQLSC
jgi:hypothetical protein